MFLSGQYKLNVYLISSSGKFKVLKTVQEEEEYLVATSLLEENEFLSNAVKETLEQMVCLLYKAKSEFEVIPNVNIKKEVSFWYDKQVCVWNYWSQVFHRRNNLRSTFISDLLPLVIGQWCKIQGVHKIKDAFSTVTSTDKRCIIFALWKI